jgi:hypothetical protein
MSKELETVLRIPRNATMEMIVKTGQYYKIDVVDVRWYSDGKPTRKGIRMNMDELDVLLKGLIKIRNKVNTDESN